MTRPPCCYDCLEHGDPITGIELPPGDLQRQRQHTNDPGALERIAQEWQADVDRERLVAATGDVTCHPDRGMNWTCLGCGAVLCTHCDGTDNGSGLCWTCYSAEDPEGSAA